MKWSKKGTALLIISAFVVLVAAYICFTCFIGTRPFKNIKMDSIKSASIYLIPPNTTEELSDEEIEELVTILHDVRIYNRSWIYMFSGGQGCIFTITFTDGTVLEVNVSSPSLIIDGKGYRAEYETCQALNQLANNICDTQWATKE